jgi:hypothetical protein
MPRPEPALRSTKGIEASDGGSEGMASPSPLTSNVRH